jgi:hypothetical protein
MSAAKDDGGQAFPSTWSESWGGEVSNNHHYGMTLRDWMAGQALAGLGTWCPGSSSGPLIPALIHERKAAWAYAQADAMLKAREATPIHHSRIEPLRRALVACQTLTPSLMEAEACRERLKEINSYVYAVLEGRVNP